MKQRRELGSSERRERGPQPEHSGKRPHWHPRCPRGRFSDSSETRPMPVSEDAQLGVHKTRGFP
eukprot:7133256-Pyramimonas_sp.AAC.1